jgi:hypothetical protein
VRPHVAAIENVEASVQWIDDKLRNCSTNHQCYGPPERVHRLPTRVLDLGSPGNGPLDGPLKLHISKQGEKARYATLSHCWGGEDPPKLERKESTEIDVQKGGTEIYVQKESTEIDVQKEIAFALLPQTYRDAVELARKLTLRYLWIDSLCVIQNDKIDRAREGADMGRIYQHSYLTIAATAAANDEIGLFWKKKPGGFPTAPGLCIEVTPRETLQARRGSWDPRVDSVFARRVLTHDGFYGESTVDAGGGPVPLITRGWVYQERALSPRLVHFCATVDPSDQKAQWLFPRNRIFGKSHF